MNMVPSLFVTILPVKSDKHLPDSSKFNLNTFQARKILIGISLTNIPHSLFNILKPPSETKMVSIILSERFPHQKIFPIRNLALKSLEIIF